MWCFLQNKFDIWMSMSRVLLLHTWDLILANLCSASTAFRSKFLVTKPQPWPIFYCLCCLFMSWSCIPAAILWRKTTGLVCVTQTSSKLHRPQNYIQKMQTTSGTFHNRVVSEFININQKTLKLNKHWTAQPPNSLIEKAKIVMCLTF